MIIPRISQRTAAIAGTILGVLLLLGLVGYFSAQTAGRHYLSQNPVAAANLQADSQRIRDTKFVTLVGTDTLAPSRQHLAAERTGCATIQTIARRTPTEHLAAFKPDGLARVFGFASSDYRQALRLAQPASAGQVRPALQAIQRLAQACGAYTTAQTYSLASAAASSSHDFQTAASTDRKLVAFYRSDCPYPVFTGVCRQWAGIWQAQSARALARQAGQTDPDETDLMTAVTGACSALMKSLTAEYRATLFSDGNGCTSSSDFLAKYTFAVFFTMRDDQNAITGRR